MQGGDYQSPAKQKNFLTIFRPRICGLFLFCYDRYMANFNYALERYTERTGQSIQWLWGFLNVFLPVIVLLHGLVLVLLANWVTWDLSFGVICAYAAIVAILGLLAEIGARKAAKWGYRCMLAFCVANVVRCVVVAGGLMHSILVTYLRPGGNAADAHMPVGLVSFFFLVIIAAELAESAAHIANMVYIKKRKTFFIR